MAGSDFKSLKGLIETTQQQLQYSRPHLLLIKQHLMQGCPKPLKSLQPKATVLTSQSISTQQMITTGKPDDSCVMMEAKKILYTNCIVQTAQAAAISCDLVVWTEMAKDEQKMKIQISGQQKTYELLQWSSSRGNQPCLLDVMIFQQKPWLIQFPNFYKCYQFQEQYKLHCIQQFEQASKPNQVLASNHMQKQRQNQEGVYLSLNIHCITYNMAREHQTIDYKQLVPFAQTYDVIVWAAQECVMSEKQDMIDILELHLGEQWLKIKCVDIWELFLVVFVKITHAQHLKHVETNYKATGALGFVGNKGGIMLTLELYGKKFCFVCCHLAAGVGKQDRRSDMMGTILQGLPLESGQAEPDQQADFTFIIGDLNYRLKSTYTNFIDRVTSAKNLLAQLDEYTHEKNNGRFPGFREMPIDFYPTYKREPQLKGPQFYINKKDQCPSYTDRVLFKQNDLHSRADFKVYGCRENVLGSDHRPVYLTMQLNLNYDHCMEPVRFVPQLSTPKIPQGRGELSFKSFEIKLQLGIRKLEMPSFFQLQFQADWLNTQPYTNEKRMKVQSEEKLWQEGDIPLLYTPINSAGVLRQRRLLVLVHLVEGASNSQTIFGAANIQFKDLRQIDEHHFSLETIADVHGQNKFLAQIQTEMHFKIKNLVKPPAQPQLKEVLTSRMSTAQVPQRKPQKIYKSLESEVTPRTPAVYEKQLPSDSLIQNVTGYKANEARPGQKIEEAKEQTRLKRHTQSQIQLPIYQEQTLNRAPPQKLQSSAIATGSYLQRIGERKPSFHVTLDCPNRVKRPDSLERHQTQTQ